MATPTQAQIDSINAQVRKINESVASYNTKNETGLSALPELNNSPKKIISSNSVLSDKNKMDARLQAGAALTSDGSSYNQQQNGFGFSPLQQMNQNLMVQQNSEALQGQQDALNIVSLKYDTALRRSNQQYNALLSDLEGNLSNDLAMATQQAAALNPYSEAQGAMTARNFKGAIQSEYQKQALRVQQQAEAAEEALRANETEAYFNITQQMKETNRTFQKNMMDFMLGAQAQFDANNQWQQEFGLKQQAFNLEASQAYEGNFFDFVDTFGADPNFKAEIDTYFQTGEVGEALMPLVKRGMQAGLTASEAMSIASYETQNQAKIRIDQQQFAQQMSLGWYNAETSRMSELRQQAADAASAGNMDAAMEYQIDLSDNIVNAAVKAIPRINSWTTGFTSYLSGVRGTDAYMLDQALEPIRAAVSFDGLQDMRNASKTGGALGQVAVRELELLSKLEGSLELGQNSSTLQNTVIEIAESRQRFANAQRRELGLPEENVNIRALVTGSSQQNSGNNAGSTTLGVYQSQSGNTYNLPF